MAEPEMYQASPEDHAMISTGTRSILAASKGNMTVAMALSISLICQVYLAAGGDIKKGEAIGSAVKEGIITTLNAYRQWASTSGPSGRA